MSQAKNAHHNKGSTDDGKLTPIPVACPGYEWSDDDAGEVLRSASDAEQAARRRAEVGVPRWHGLETVEERAICVKKQIGLISIEVAGRSRRESSWRRARVRRRELEGRLGPGRRWDTGLGWCYAKQRLRAVVTHHIHH